MTSSTQRTVVITGVGAERGIGRATAHRFARDGWAVAGLDLDGDASAKLAAELTEQYGVPAYGGTVNVADEDSVLAARDAVHAADLPTVGAVLNIAGITSPVPFLETTLDLWNKIFAVNATGTYLVTKAFLPDMIDGGYGRIVNMSSVSAQQGGGVFGKTPYSSAKAAVIGFTRSLARELGPTGITVNAIAAGAVDTDIRSAGTTPELEASIVAGTSRWAGRPPSTTSPRCSRSWPPKRPGTSPRPPRTSTAAPTSPDPPADTHPHSPSLPLTPLRRNPQ